MAGESRELKDYQKIKNFEMIYIILEDLIIYV